MEVVIRPATGKDMHSITEIYAAEVENGLVSFELSPPDTDEMNNRFNALIQAGFPYFVAELDGAVAGYAYFGSFRSRPAYNWTIENSVYVSPRFQKQGIGKKLLAKLIQAAEQQGFRQMMAVIGNSDNHGSVALHQSCGFEMVGIEKNVGWKCGQWLDCVIMQRSIGRGSTTAAGNLERPFSSCG